MLKAQFDSYLATLIKDDYIVTQAMNYSLLGSSKRVRPLLLLNLLIDYNLDVQIGFDAACALEMIHTYSLIHDDLPAFDNDDYRRGRLTCHKAFNEEIAILAGDGLLTKAFEILANSNYAQEVKLQLIKLLAEYAGEKGMIKGQALDMQYEDIKVNLTQLIEMEELKTGKLLTYPLLAASIIAGKAEDIDLFIQVGKKIGLAFQIQDDLLDVTSSADKMGKSLSDLSNSKSTFVSLLTNDKAKEYTTNLFNEAYALLQDKYPHLKTLINQIETRER